jgi:hypothetical protein
MDHDDLIWLTGNHRPDPGGTREVPPMIVERIRRLANGRTSCGGLRPEDRADGGVLVLERDPRADGRQWPAWLLQVLSCVIAFPIVLISFQRSPKDLGFLAFMAGIVLVLSYTLLRHVLSLEKIRIDASGLEYLRVDGLMRKRRVIPLPEIRRLIPYSVMVNEGRYQKYHPEYGLAIETIGRPLCVGQSRDPDAPDRLSAELEWHLQDRYPAWVDQPQCVDCEILDASGIRPDPPSDSTLSCRREWDRTEFVRPIRKGRLTIRRPWLYVLAFNGPLGVFLLLSASPAISAFLAGLVISGLVVLCATGRRCWVVRPGEITRSFRVAGLGWSRTTDIEWLARMELRRLPSDVPWNARFELALVDLDGEDRATLGPLTEGEARWMAGIVADVLKDALPRNGQEIYRWSVSAEAPAAGSRAMADAWLDEGLAGPGAKGGASKRG